MKDFKDGLFHLFGELSTHNDNFLLGKVESSDHGGADFFDVG
jgi:hypothetical protein